ncbi:aldehyde dehydrogenase family protein [Zhongshania aquimaris]|uniref:Aldehyde dehydrogenase family protein n=1 Tax=Zhongshania aquimaris TaxID=2857107 RepID=A0ABS6VV38_9GAMM|nr:aldehyde dehydrogenase family protein [Zhongshania aquimaris]MBW2942199.1 aldehyde dehydrogenase family protein [Zhongshania aquimaris]
MNYKLLINGESVDSTTKLEVINPATGEVFDSCPSADGALLNEAVAAAKVAQLTWKKSLLSERQRVLKEIATSIANNREELARIITCEQGKTLDFSLFEVDAAQKFCEWFSNQEIPGKKVIEESELLRVEQTRVPLGVVGCITPWNFPLLQAVYKIAPALLTGNAVVVKPAPTTPLSTLFLGQIIKGIVPAGLVNIVSGGNELGALLSAHPDVAKISLTGSIETGKKVVSSSAGNLKKVTLELGGNDAAILLSDIDIAKVIPAVFATSFINSGQVCIAIKRLYVPDEIYDDVCDALSELVKSAVVGDGLNPESQFGPLQNAAQLSKFHHYLDLAKRDGNIIATSECPDSQGYFAPLILVRDILDGTPLVDEEPFCPILPVIRYSSLDDVIYKANSMSFGLGGSVWSSDLDKAQAVAERLECGTAWVNQHCAFAPNIPFGGIKQSGIGIEFGDEGILEFTDMKITSISKA